MFYFSSLPPSCHWGNAKVVHIRHCVANSQVNNLIRKDKESSHHGKITISAGKMDGHNDIIQSGGFPFRISRGFLLNKLASLEAVDASSKLCPLASLLTGVRCRATSVAKNSVQFLSCSTSPSIFLHASQM